MSLDSASRARLRTAYPDLAVRVFRLEQDVRNHFGYQIRVTEVIRTLEYQAKLYARGRTEPGPKVTNCQPGESIHHYGLAFDICFAGPDPYLETLRKKDALRWEIVWRKLGELAQGHGLTWGYDWNGNGIVDANDFDRPHFQLTYGKSLAEIQSLYKFGGMASVWAAMDKVRQVPQGSEWNGVTTRQRLLDIGVLT